MYVCRCHRRGHCGPVRRLGHRASDVGDFHGRRLHHRPDRGGGVPHQPQDQDRHPRIPRRLEGPVPQGRELAGGAGGVPTGRHHRVELYPRCHRDRLCVQRDHLHHRERWTHGSAHPGGADQGSGCAAAEGGRRAEKKRNMRPRTAFPFAFGVGEE